jgi:hypothetical protein
MSYSLPKYYFQDIHPDVMDEIMCGMQEALPDASTSSVLSFPRGEDARSRAADDASCVRT